MRETKVLFGTGQTGDGRYITRTEASLALREIGRYAAEQFGGYSLYRHDGGWINAAGALIQESGVTLSVFGIPLPEQETTLARKIRALMVQDSVVLVRAHSGEAEFVND